MEQKVINFLVKLTISCFHQGKRIFQTLCILVNSLFQKMKQFHKNFGFIRLSFLLVICGVLTSFTLQQMASVEVNNNYMSLNINQLSVYNEHVDDKFYYAPTLYEGIQISLNDVSYSPFLELVAGGGYQIIFYRDNEWLGETFVDDVTRHVIEVPNFARELGYDRIVFVPISGKILYLSYLSFLSNYEENIVFEPIGARSYSAYSVSSWYGGNLVSSYYYDNGTPYMVDGLFSHVVSYSTEELFLDVSSINNELGCHLLQVVDSSGNIIAKFEGNAYLPAYTQGAEDLLFTLPVLNKNFIVSDLILEYQYEGGDEVKTWEINPFVQINEELYHSTEIRTKDNMADFDFLTIDGNTVKFNSKSVVLDKSLFIPAGYRLIVEEGQFIDLQNDALLFCRDYVTFNGTEENPIFVTSTDDSLYCGLVVMRGSNISRLNHVHFDNLGEAQSGIWKLTGAVTFYESDVVIDNCKFLNNRSEDGLNSVRCHIEVNNSYFENTFQDAYDADFCTGSFVNVTFVDSGNDAFDVSTSTFYLENCSFYNTHDKAISTGENSTITANGIFVDGAQSGLAAKDSSHLTVDNATVKNVFIGVCVYQKKPEFGATTVIIDNYSLEGSYDFEYIIQEQDTVILNGTQLIASNKQKENLIIDRMIEEIDIT